MVPHSLRWDVTPLSDVLDTGEWFQFFNDAGLKLIQHLLGKKLQKLLKVDTEICALKEKLNPFKGSEDYAKKSELLRKHLEKEEVEQRNKKNFLEMFLITIIKR